jgi:hypothetical protein
MKKRHTVSHNLIYIFIAATLVFISAQAYGGIKVTSFKCEGNKEIKVGTTKYNAIEMCGEPEARETKSEKGNARNEVEEWKYICVLNKHSYLLVFKGRNLMSIERFSGEGEGCKPASTDVTEKYEEPVKTKPQENNRLENIKNENINQRLDVISKSTGIPADTLMKEALDYLEKKYREKNKQ